MTIDEITTPPSFVGEFGRAWIADLEAQRRILKVDFEDDATVIAMMVECPNAHPAWHSYFIACVHLRLFVDGRTTFFYREDATHEIWVYAMNPDFSRQEYLYTAVPHLLTPCNFASQFVAASDAVAKEMILEAARDIVEGRLSPDTDFTSAWIARFGDCMMKDRSNRKPPIVRGKPN